VCATPTHTSKEERTGANERRRARQPVREEADELRNRAHVSDMSLFFGGFFFGFVVCNRSIDRSDSNGWGKKKNKTGMFGSVVLIFFLGFVCLMI
jgi:hypothetical protein